MPFPFTEICTLLSALEEIETQSPPLPSTDRTEGSRSLTDGWFKSHRRSLNALSVEGATALLSAFLPERRTDRVYGLQAQGLCRLLGRSLALSVHRHKDLEAYRQPGRGDLGACLERVLRAGGPPALPAVTLEEVDELLLLLAGQCRFSDPSILRLPPGPSEVRNASLANIFRRVSPDEGRWLVRMILKDLGPVRVDERLVLKSYHFMLPDLLRFQQDFNAALTLLKGPLKKYPERPDFRSERLHFEYAEKELRPAINVKVGRPTFHKARSIDHCLKMISCQKRWAVERKYDGEYCEIHVDLETSPDPLECIKIFSKSGKDSTLDRKLIHQTLVDSLQLGGPDCKIKRHAIILGELVVYSDKEKQVMSFEEIRKHVTRSGTFIGTDNDTPHQPWEHLAIAFFDLLLWDDMVLMREPVDERRQYLREVYTKISGKAFGAAWNIVDFSNTSQGRRLLMNQFAASNASRCEGLVLKPCDVPYFSLGANPDYYRHSFVKLKKDYFADMGDEVDLAVIGASYNAQQAQKCGVPAVKWTDFHLGALVNKPDVQRFDVRPIFKFVGTIQQDFCIPKPILETANILGNLSASKFDPPTQPTGFNLQGDGPVKMDVVFDKPLVFEVLGSGFEKPSNCDFLMLRHARVKKLHQDRSWRDCTSFQELQEKGHASRAAPVDSESQEIIRQLDILETKCKRKFERERTSTPRSRASTTPRTARANRISSSEICRSSARRLSFRVRQASTERRPLQDLAHNSLPTPISTGEDNPVAPQVLVDPAVAEQEARLRKRSATSSGGTPCPQPKRRRTADNQPTSASSRNTNPIIISDDETSPKVPTIASKPPRRALQEQQLLPIGPKDNNRNEFHHPINTTAHCHAHCTFANTVLYLAPCISQAPYISHDLLSLHDETLLISSLSHWDRDSFAHAPNTSVVSESQPHIGMRKLVLVESKRRQVLKDVLQQLVGLDQGKLRERIEVWDWRVLEKCQRHDVGSEKLRRGYFVGATCWDEGEGRTTFVPNTLLFLGYRMFSDLLVSESQVLLQNIR